MTWLRFLYHLSLVITVAVDAVVLCHVYPAFKRTRNKAFIFIVIACSLGIIDTVYDHTANLQALADHDYIVARTFRRFMYFADMICWCIGMVLLIRPYLNTPAPVVAEGAQDVPANRSQPAGPQTNQTPPAAGSGG